MSLINQMLNDLKSNKQPLKEGLLYPTQTSASESRRYLSIVLKGLVLFMLINVLIAAVLLWNKQVMQPIKLIKKTKITKKKSPPLLTSVVPKIISTSLVSKMPVTKQYRTTRVETAKEKFEKAQALVDGHDYKSAEGILVSLMSEHAQFLPAYQLLADIYLSENDFDNAAQLLNQARKQFKNDLGLVEQHAQLYLAMEQPQRAITILEKYHPPIVNNVQYYALLAGAYEQKGRHVKAGELYRMLLQYRPDKASFWLGYAVSLDIKSQYHQAVSAYIKAMNAHDVNPVILAYAQSRVQSLRG